MGGQRNGKLFLRYFIGIVCLFVSVYILYSYSQVHNQVKVKTNHLKVAEEEHRALSKRFDILSSELKNTVQTSADLEKQLRIEKSSHIQTTKEKEESQRQYQTEVTRREIEMGKLSKEKAQLIEEKDQFKQEKDRLSSRLDTLTQECSEARDSATSAQHRLQVECDAKLDEYTGRMAAQFNEIRNALDETRDNLARCKGELNSAHEASEQCQLQQQQQQQQQQYRYQHDSNSQRNDHEPQARGYRSNSDPNQHSFQNPPADSKYSSLHKSPPYKGNKGMVGAGNFRQAQNHPDIHREEMQFSPPNPGSRLNAGHQNYQVGKDTINGDGGVEDHHLALSDREKRVVYQSLKSKIDKGEMLDDKKTKLYRYLSRLYGNESPSPRGMESENHLDQDVHVPSVHGNSEQEEVKVHGNSEQEEVKDLVDGQQKAVEFDNANVKENAADTNVGGAGGPREEHDDVDEIEEVAENHVPMHVPVHAPVGERDHEEFHAEDKDGPLEKEGGHVDDNNNNNALPIERPGGQNEAREGQLEDDDDDPVANEDDNDVNDYGRNLNRRDDINNDGDDGHRAFMEDQRLYDEERKRLQSKESVVGEKDPPPWHGGRRQFQDRVLKNNEMK